MGVGVFTSDFGSAGTTFIISGPLATDDEYEQYLKDAEDPLDRSEWSTDQYDDFVEHMTDTVRDALRQIGFFQHDDRRGHHRASFDSDFVSASYNGVAEVGWRSWEHDFVIGTAGSGRWQETMADPGAYVADFAAEQGMDPEKAKPGYLELIAALDEYVRIALQEAGFECRYRTSGYTTSAYDRADNPSAKMEELAAIITDRVQSLALRFEDRVPAMDRSQRVEFAKMVDKDRVGISIETPFIDHRSGRVMVSTVDGGTLYGNYEVTDSATAGYLAGLKATEMASPIPLNAHTADLYARIRSDRAGYGNLFLSPDELEEALDETFTPTYEAGDGETVRVTFETAPAQSPGI